MIKELTPEHLQHNWNNLIRLLEVNFSGERLENLLKMYDYFEERMMFAPASGREHFHNSHAGGYVEHVIHVTTSALKIKAVWEQTGATIDFTDEEMVFAALHHDLGKVGDLSEDYYSPNDSDWHIKNMGKIFKINPNNPFALVNDLSIWLLQHYDIKISFNEMIAIQTHDGLYDDANVKYLKTFLPEQKPRTSLPYILHQADLMAARIEFEQEWLPKLKGENSVEKQKPQFTLKSKANVKSKALNNISSPGLKDMLDNL